MQKIVFLYLYFILGFFVVFFLWCLAGFGITGNRAFSETCDMMRLHVAGDRNPTVLEELHCDEIAGAKAEINSAVVAGNDAVADINAELDAANQEIIALNPAHEDVPLLCAPFALNDTMGEYVLVTEATDGCTLLSSDAVNATYADRVCEADLPANPDPQTNPEYAVRTMRA